MTRLFEAPHGWVDDFLHKASSAGLTAEHLRMLNTDPHLLKEWVGSLPVPEQDDLSMAKVGEPAARVSLKEAFSDGKIDERIQTHLVERMGLGTLDELAQLCGEELMQIRNFGPATLRRVEQVLAEHGMQLSVHETSGQHVSFALPFTGWGVLYARSGELRVNHLANVRIVLGRQLPTVDEFRAMSDEDRLQLFDEWTIQAIFQAIQFYRI